MFPDTYNLKSITAGNGTVYTFNYDTFYDDVSNIKVGGKTLIEHEYAAYNGRLTRSDYGNGAYTENVYESEWDNSVIGIKYNGSQLYSYSYDSSGKVGTQTDSENGVKYRYEYDEIGRMTGEYSNEGYDTHITYNEYNEPTQIKSNILMSGAYAQTYYADKVWKRDITYNDDKLVESSHFGYGKISYTYDTLGRVTGTVTWDNAYKEDFLYSYITYRQLDENTTTTQISRYTVGGKNYDYTYDGNGKNTRGRFYCVDL